MKKLFLLLMLPLLAVSFNSCSSSDDDDSTYDELIVGTWKMTEVLKVEGDYEDDWSFDLETIRFNSNKTFQFIDGDGGTYSISGKKLTITYSGDDDDTEVMDIVSLNKTEWVFKVSETDSWGDSSGAGGSTTTTYTVRAAKQ